MKVVINTCFGGFSLSKFAVEQLHLKNEYSDIDRDDPELIELVEKYPDRVSGRFAELRVAYFPDAATDWTITEYDGAESVIYVLNGKLHYI